MPFAVAHMLIPMILLDMLRDNILKIKKNKLPNRYILIAGIFGLLPDIDIPLSLIVFKNLDLHRTITHSIWIPIVLLLFSSIFYITKKHKWSLILFLSFFGVAIHILLDFLTSNSVSLLYPVNKSLFGISLFPTPMMTMTFYSILDAVLLFFWFVRVILRKRVQDVV